ncbi:hypothetical protein [Brucella anthropi]|uniref:hypothetical protein n=1 Tax=Brucella anthropi TaxID=529 RepID=UPI001F2E6914|nr:hypothetical protein [Brucella anthropi]
MDVSPADDAAGRRRADIGGSRPSGRAAGDGAEEGEQDAVARQGIRHAALHDQPRHNA